MGEEVERKKRQEGTEEQGRLECRVRELKGGGENGDKQVCIHDVSVANVGQGH